MSGPEDMEYSQGAKNAQNVLMYSAPAQRPQQTFRPNTQRPNSGPSSQSLASKPEVTASALMPPPGAVAQSMTSPSHRQTECYNQLKSFEIEKKIGKGQFSEVYRARCTVDHQVLALKKVQVSGVKSNNQILLIVWLICFFLILPLLQHTGGAHPSPIRFYWFPIAHATYFQSSAITNHACI